MMACDHSPLSRSRDEELVCAIDRPSRVRVSSIDVSASRCSTEPTIAVVICTRNRPKSLALTLDSIWTQTRLPDELIVIDDGCLPGAMRDALGRRCRQAGILWQYCRKDFPGLTRSRNVASDLALSEVLLFLDDDATCERACLAEITKLMADPRVAGVTALVSEPRFSSRAAKLYQAGYRVAGWWSVHPRRLPKIDRPAVLKRPDVAVRAKWLSGAAMAVRRDLVRRHRFDERLTAYALGEDREFGYRLMSEYWLLETKRVRVTHRREESQRTDPRRLGFMTAFNYLYILRKTCRLGAGDWLLIGWSLAVLAAMHAAWAVVGDRAAHLGELRGMFSGIVAALRGAVRAALFGTRRQAVRLAAPSSESPLVGLRPLAGHHAVGRPWSVSCPAVARVPSKRRVLFVSTRLNPGGAELMLMTLAERLPQQGIEPYILGLKSGGSLIKRCREMGIPVFDGLLKHKLDVFVIRRIQQLVAEHRIDVVTVAHSGGDRMFWSTIAAHTLGVPVVVWSHWFPTPADPHFERSNRLLYRWVDAYVALGEAHRAALVRHAHVPAGRIRIIRNAIDFAAFEGPGVRADLRATTREALGLEDHHVAIGIIANLRQVKRHDVFIEAARRLAPHHPEMRFFIVGDGPDRESVQADAARACLDKGVLRFLGHRTDLPVLLSALDISCLCSEIECFSVGMLEAAAAGCAFIGPAAGAMTEFLEHHVTGLAIEPADVTGLADAMERLAMDAELRRRLANAARERALRDYGIDRSARSFADLFRELVNAERHGGACGSASVPGSVRTRV